MPEDEEDISPRVWRTISRLADLLRKSGSAVLTDRSALSLSWPVYQDVSTALAISSSRTECQSRALNVKLVLDLEYLANFLARVPRLQLYQETVAHAEFHGLIHLAGLDQLRAVSFTKIPVHLIQDLVQVRSQLESLALHRCCFSLDSLISSCLGSTPSVSPWPRLSVLKVSHCDLTCLGPCLQWTPALARLDCSHNAISDTSGLEMLSQLTHLNMSFNKLSEVPVFYPGLALSVLLLGYNNIEQLGPITDLEQLVHLDLTGNCLMHHDVLAPVSGLTNLTYLDLTNNPLYSAPRHRDTASSWLNPAVASLNPSLDRRRLSRAEVLQVGSSRLVISPQVSPARPVTEEVEEEEEVQSVSPSCQEDLLSVSCAGSLVSVSTVSKRKRRRRRKVREAVITDESDFTSATTETESELKTDQTEEKSEVTETLQDLREKYGDNWLRSGASDTLQSLLGIEPSQADTNTTSIIQNMVEVERQQTQASCQTKEEELPEEISDKVTTEELKLTSRRSSDEVPDAIDKADDVKCGAELEGDITSKLAETEVRAEAKVSVGSDNFYSSHSEREREVSPSDKSCKVNVVRNIPGDDSGLGEELVLVISKDQLQEQDRRGVTRARWFLHSLEEMELVGKLDNDRVKAVMMFNTVRKDVRVREYIMSEAGYSTVMALVSEVLEAAALACSSLPSLQCVKCQAVFSSRGGQGDTAARCPHCGSTMVLETTLNTNMEEEENVCMGIPACEMLDLEAITETAGLETEEMTNTVLTEPDQPGPSGVVELSVTADIHSLPLPDLLPRPEPRRSSSPNPGEKGDSKERSSSPTLTRSNSSSDISVISSEASIEVIPSLLVPPPPMTKTNAVSPVLGAGMVESSSSDSMVNSLVAGESCQSPVPSTPLVFKTPLSTPVKKEAMSSPSSRYSSVTTTPVKARDNNDYLDDTAAFHSCQESSDTSTEEVREETEPDLPRSPISWNTRDFSKADHRVLLYCELTLFREEEDLLVLAKADIHVRSSGGMFPGVLVVTNKKTYILAITAQETEEPGDWLELVTVGEVSRVARLVGLVGRLGVGLEVSASKQHHHHQPFYRLSSVAAYTGQEEGDCYQVVLGARDRTEMLVDQLLSSLQERVRSVPTPLTWLAPDQEAVLSQQLGCQQDVILTARCVESDSWLPLNIVLASSSLIITEQFFYWLFTAKHRQLAVKHRLAIDDLEALAVYQTCPERIRLEFPSLVLKLMFHSETGVQELVRGLRKVWEQGRGTTLEEVTRFHLQGGKDVVTMQTLMMEDSVSPQSFDLSQWIKVTSQTGVSMK